MKVIQYELCTRVNQGTQEHPVWEENLSLVTMQWNAVNEQVAAQEAYKGIYSVIEQPEEISAPTRLDAMEAQLAYTAMMTDTLLEV